MPDAVDLATDIVSLSMLLKTSVFCTMKKLLVISVIAAVLAATAWQNRLNLLIWAAPKLTALSSDIQPNRPLDWSVGPDTAQAPADQRPPNIILIMADDMGFNDISLYNGGAADGSLMTPNIDALATDGVRFNNGYAGNAVCAPSRAISMTGRYNTRFGYEFTPFFKIGVTIMQWMFAKDPPPLPPFIDEEKADAMPGVFEAGMPGSEITVAEMLRDAGYYTAHIGKWHLGSVGEMTPNQQGFEDSLELSGILYLPEDHPDVVNQKFPADGTDTMVWASGKFSARFNGSEEFAPARYLTDYYTDEAVNVIEANRNRPFFLYLAHWAPHNPLQASRKDFDALAHIEDHGLRVYAAMLRSLDRSVARITQALTDNGLSDNTLILFTSDNGGANYIELPDINQPYRGWKMTHFEGGLHVPFIAKWPAKLSAGEHYEQAVHHMDLAPTIAAAAGATLPSDRKIDGVDLIPFLRGENNEPPHRTLFWRTGHHQSVLHEGWKLIRANQPELPPGSPQKKFLFHLAADPTEQHNLAKEHPDKVAELEELLAAHNAEQVEPLWPSIVDGPMLIDNHNGQPYEPGDEYIYWAN